MTPQISAVCISVLLFSVISSFVHGQVPTSCECYFGGDHNVVNRCLGVFCGRDDQCASGICKENFCADDKGKENCNRNADAECGRCPGLVCPKPIDPSDPVYKYKCQYGCGTEDGQSYRCTDCTCDRDNIKHHLCVGKYCLNDTECASGFCYKNYCTANKDDSTNCNMSPFSKCGRCPDVACSVEKFSTQGFECKFTACLTSKGNKCSACECDRTISTVSLCDGVYCDSDQQCASGRCYLGFCAKNDTTTEACVTDEDWACGKCDKVKCRRSRECQNGSCDSGFCYDTHFWLILLIAVIVFAFLLVSLVSLYLVRKRRAERVNDYLRSGSSVESEPLNINSNRR